MPADPFTCADFIKRPRPLQAWARPSGVPPAVLGAELYRHRHNLGVPLAITGHKTIEAPVAENRLRSSLAEA